MFRPFGWLKRFRRRREEPSDPRAEELRRKLAESRAIVEEREEFEGAETTVDQAESAPARAAEPAELPPDDPESRRQAVHEAGRAAAQRMRGEP